MIIILIIIINMILPKMSRLFRLSALNFWLLDVERRVTVVASCDRAQPLSGEGVWKNVD